MYSIHNENRWFLNEKPPPPLLCRLQKRQKVSQFYAYIFFIYFFEFTEVPWPIKVIPFASRRARSSVRPITIFFAFFFCKLLFLQKCIQFLCMFIDYSQLERVIGMKPLASCRGTPPISFDWKIFSPITLRSVWSFIYKLVAGSDVKLEFFLQNCLWKRTSCASVHRLIAQSWLDPCRIALSKLGSFHYILVVRNRLQQFLCERSRRNLCIFASALSSCGLLRIYVRC